MASKIRQLQTDITTVIGPSGATGPAGPSGVAGPSGSQGPVGPSGAQGPTGPSGAIGPSGSSGSSTSSNYSSAILTGLGQNFSGWYTLSLTNLGNNHPVNGITGVIISPSTTSTIVDATLNINGFNYYLDNYINISGATLPGIYGTTLASGGFSLDLTGPKIKWNYTNYAGFTLNNTDNIVLRYQV
jgi:hypothetical protein